jgi:4-amino-4-deoxychorismate lyase
MGLAPLPCPELVELADAALAAAGAPDAVLRFLWTAGRDPEAPVGLALVSPIPGWIEHARTTGIRLVSLLGARAEAPWLLGGVKSTSYAVNMAAEAEAKRRGADDAVFVDHDDVVLEGPVSNVWWRRGTTLVTPALELGILAGVTRAELLELAPQLGYELEEGTFTLAELAAADEAFTSSSVREVLPVSEVDGAPIPLGDAAPALQAALREVASG